MQVLILMEGLKLQAFENEAFRKIFVAQKNDVAQKNEVMRDIIIQVFYFC
jgi:hypothetical protein